MKGTSCEECAYFEYDEEEESYAVNSILMRMILQGRAFMVIAIFVRIFSTKMSIELLESKFKQKKILTNQVMLFNIKMKNKGERR